MITRRTFLAASSASIVAGNAFAQQNYPNRLVKIVVPSQPGAPNDIAARLVAKVLGELWNQPMVVENRSGAGGLIGTAAVAKAAPDGYTLLVHSNSFVANGVLYKNAPYDLDRDFANIFYIGGNPFVIVVAKDSFPDLKALVAAATKSPGKLNFSSAGLGSVTHLAAELFVEQAKIRMAHVPYRGTLEALNSVVSGDTQCMFAPPGAADALLKGKKLTALAVTSAAERDDSYPDVPTLRELGYPNYDLAGWQGVWAPKATPADILTKIHDDLSGVFPKPEATSSLAAMHVKHVPMTRQEFNVYVRNETALFRGIAKTANISLD